MMFEQFLRQQQEDGSGVQKAGPKGVSQSGGGKQQTGQHQNGQQAAGPQPAGPLEGATQPPSVTQPSGDVDARVTIGADGDEKEESKTIEENTKRVNFKHSPIAMSVVF